MERFNTERLTENKIEIQPIGDYFQGDEEGFLINPASPEKIQDEWKSAFNDVIEVYKKEYGDKLRNVYIRGSVATGKAIKGVSDFDTFAYVDSEKEAKDQAWIGAGKEQLLEKYPFVTDFELVASPVSKATEQTVMLNQSMCIYGERIDAPKIKPGKELARNVFNFGEELKKRRKSLLEEDLDDEQIRDQCVWIMKTTLRVGFEITMERCKKYTRDLYPCYKTFLEYYPEKESAMKEAFEYALNPTNNKEEVIEVIDTLGAWLTEESRKYF